MRFAPSLLALAGALALAGCHGDDRQDEQRWNDDNGAEMFNDNVANVPEAEAPQNVGNVVEKPKPVAPPQISAEQQMQDDADATGMTSRLPDSNESGVATADTGNHAVAGH